MIISKLGRIATPNNAAEVRDQITRDLTLGAIETGLAAPPVQPGTDWWLLATALGNACYSGMAGAAVSLDSVNPLTATGNDLDALLDAHGVPFVDPTGASGQIIPKILGATSILDKQAFTLPNGLRGHVVGNYLGVSDGTPLNVQMDDTGSNTNAKGGTTVAFVSPPPNVAVNARVSDDIPLQNGTDDETDERKRARLLDTLRNKPGGGNWSHVRQMILEAFGSISDVYIYPALGGPGSGKVVPVRQMDTARKSFTRAIPSVLVSQIQAKVLAQLPSPAEIVIQASADVNLDMTMLLNIPQSVLNGGNGLGWTDYPIWPTAVPADTGKVTISAVTATNDGITVTAQTTTAPVPGLTHIAWWSTVDRQFYTALVVSQSGSAGAWVLTLDRALIASDGSGPSVGDYICPPAHNVDVYASSWLQLFQSLGPGENTTDTYRIPRAARHPFTADEDPSDLNAGTISRWIKQFPEIANYGVGYASVGALTPGVPGSVATAPNIFTPYRFAIYPL